MITIVPGGLILPVNLIANREKSGRDFHMHPELSGQEQRTAGIVADKLREYGLKVSTGVGGHGVIGLLEGKRDGPIVAGQADMDAFPGDEYWISLTSRACRVSSISAGTMPIQRLDSASPGSRGQWLCNVNVAVL